MTEPIDKATKIPPIPWAYTEDEKMEMFSIHTAGQDPVDCDNLFLVCGIWYQSSGREQGKAIADFIINSVNTAWAEKLKQLETQSHDQVRIIEYLEQELAKEREVNKQLMKDIANVKILLEIERKGI